VPSTRSTQVRSIRTRKALAAAGIVLAGLSLGSGVAGAFPNGPGIIQNDPQPPPPPPQNPDDKAPPPQQPQPPQGPQEWAAPEPGPVQPIPGPGPQQGGGNGGGQQGGGATDAAPAPNGGPTAEELATIAGLVDAPQADTDADAEDLTVDGVVGKESDRPSNDTTAELAAGELTAESSQSGVAAVLTALAASVVAGLLGLWFFLARRRNPHEETTTTA
jgi:hypothetical protein